MRILSYIDGLNNLDSFAQILTQLSSPATGKISLLHVIPEGNIATDDNTDFSLIMAPNNRAQLMEKLSKLDTEKSKINNDRARIIMNYTSEILRDSGFKNINTILKRDDFISSLIGHAQEHDIIVLSKQCEHHFSRDITHITHYLEPILQQIDKPILVTDQMNNMMTKAVFAFDGSEKTMKALSFLESHALNGVDEMHILSIGLDDTQKLQAEAVEKRLSKVGYRTILTFKEGKPTEVIADYLDYSSAHILIAGAYGHSKIRHFLLGSTTNYLLQSLKKPMLLF